MRRQAMAAILLLGLGSALEAQAPPEGKVISAQGTVEYRPVKVQAWAPAKILQALFVQDRVHTLALSRAAILFQDETQVRLGANAELMVRSLKDRAGGSSVMDLVQGEGWFRTKNPASDLHVSTPGATAAIRGTEINLRVTSPDETVLTVVEGSVEFSNDQGTITVNSGEEAVARKGQPPTKRLLLNPEDAVQWVIYYPLSVSWHDLLAEPMSEASRSAFAVLKNGDAKAALAAFLPLARVDVWGRIGASMAYLDLGDFDNASKVLGAPVTGALEAERLSQQAAVSLSTGDVQAASAALAAAKAAAPDSLRAATLASTVELARNNQGQANELSQGALSAHPDSVSANVAAGEAAQSLFDLPQALRDYDAAIRIDPEDVRARVDRARVLFGIGKADEAARDAEQAALVAPRDPQVRSLRGFILISRGEMTAARAEFEAAAEADPSFGEPHLGLGLLAFKQGKADDGLWELLIATLLDPKIALFQSYLGKAYFQLLRFNEGLAALDSAARLDPRDPTPHLYKSYLLRDLYRNGDALEELNTAIALNDNRAVYRGRLLLDQDRATKNLSLAQTYSDMGLQARGVSEGLNSLDTDFTNASAHLFLSDLYGDLPDRLQAQGSELLLFIIFSPVNQNSFASYNEYTSLFEQPRFSLSGFLDGAYPAYGDRSYPSYYSYADVSTRGGNDSWTHVSLLHFQYQAGARPGQPDLVGMGDIIAKASLGPSSNAFLHVTARIDDTGSPEGTIALLQDPTGNYAVNVQTWNVSVDPNVTNEELLVDVAAGVRHDWSIGFPLMAVVQYEYVNFVTLTPDFVELGTGLPWNDTVRFYLNQADAELQQVLRPGDRFQVLAGADAFYSSVNLREWRFNPTTGAPENFLGILYNPAVTNSYQQGAHGWLWAELQALPFLHVSAAAFYQSDQGTNMVTPSQAYNYNQFYPAVGLTFDLGPAAVIRAAAFQFRTTRLFPQTVYPCSMAGFLLDRNEEIYTLRTEAHVSLDDMFGPLFLSNHLYFRQSEYPPLSSSLLTKAQTIGFSTDANWLISKNFGAAVNNQLTASAAAGNYFSPVVKTLFTVYTDQLDASVTFTSSTGLSVTIANELIYQAFVKSIFPATTGSTVDLLNARIHYELPGKHGHLELSVTNLLNQTFTLFTEGLETLDIHPYLRMTFEFRWKL